MFHMLTCFNLKPGIEIGTFRDAYQRFVEHMRSIDLVVGTSPIGRRQSDTKMDTDGERDHKYFVIMSFRDRAQVDRAFAKLMQHEGTEEIVHQAVYSKAANPIFICWEDME